MLEAAGYKDRFLASPNQLGHTFFAKQAGSANVAKAIFAALNERNKAVAGEYEMGRDLRGGQQFNVGLCKPQQDFFHGYIL